MLKHILLTSFVIPFSLSSHFAYANTISSYHLAQEKNIMGQDQTAKQTNQISYVYKIMTLNDWEESQKLGYIKPSTLDNESKFIHLSEQYQVQSTIDKFMKGQGDIMILTLDPKHFIGRLVKEKNPGGNTEYYHLYEGKIPLSAIIESKMVKA